MAAEPGTATPKGAETLPSSFVGSVTHWLRGPRPVRWLDSAFGIDLRTLALFRALIGLVVISDLCLRFVDLRAFYTDTGVMPRSWLTGIEGPWRLSLHYMSGEAWVQALLMSVTIVAAMAMVLGWRTRLATFLTWLLVVSLDARNPLILLGGDYLLGELLFWAMFLPIGARASVDAALATHPPPAANLHRSWASAGILFQTFSVYLFGALAKTGHEWWPDGTAVYYALSIDGYAWPWSRWLLDLPRLTQLLTWYVWWLELLAVPLLLQPFFMRQVRAVVLVQLVLMHTGFLALMAIGFFPLVSYCSLSLLLGSWAWDGLARRWALGRGLSLYYDGTCAGCARLARVLRELLILPRAHIGSAQADARAAALHAAQGGWIVVTPDERAHLGGAAWAQLLRASPLTRPLGALLARRGASTPPATTAASQKTKRLAPKMRAFLDTALSPHARRFTAGSWTQAFAALMLAALLSWNIAVTARLPLVVFDALSPLLFPLRLEQFWQMFAPFPFKDNGWYVMPGKLADGSEVDALRPGKPLSYDKPWSVALDLPNQRWQVYQFRLYDRRFRRHREYWAKWVCRQWNGAETDEAKHLLTFNIVYMLERTPPPGAARHREQVVLWRHECVPGDTPKKPEGASTDNLPLPVE